MTVIFPEGTLVEANESLFVVQSVADLEAIDLSTEIGALTTVDGSYYLFGRFTAGGDTATGNAPKRHGEKGQRQVDGDTTFSIERLQIMWDPQGSDSVDANKVKAALEPGTSVVIVQRPGIPNDGSVPPVATQKYIAHHVRCGLQIQGRTSDDAFGEYCLNQTVSYIEPPVHGAFVA